MKQSPSLQLVQLNCGAQAPKLPATLQARRQTWGPSPTVASSATTPRPTLGGGAVAETPSQATDRPGHQRANSLPALVHKGGTKKKPPFGGHTDQILDQRGVQVHTPDTNHKGHTIILWTHRPIPGSSFLSFPTQSRVNPLTFSHTPHPVLRNLLLLPGT